ncbi:MAG TPA: hypothetical protein VE842_01585 [Pyrinomonadaceae bacterium]|nr:hypothetical protein [Pyrinomonadaceae bacterium]
MKRTRCGKTVACLTALAFTLVSLSLFHERAKAQGDDNADGVELRPGLLIHPTLNVAYVMTPDGVAAVDIATGSKQWTTNAAAKPLALAGNLLISQVEPRTAGNRLELVALDIQRRGAPTVRGATEMPANVRVSIGETLQGTFLIEAHPVANNVLLDWSFRRVPRRGMRGKSEDPEQMKSRDAEPLGQGLRQVETTTTGGELRMSLSTGAVTRQDSRTLSLNTQKSRPNVLLSERVSDEGESRYESADGLHILASERVADDRVWDKYRWTVYERSTGRRLGEFRTHLSFNPFVVRDSLVIFETTPFVLRGAPTEPAKLRAFSLSNGREAWSVEVREIVYRGPYPP